MTCSYLIRRLTYSLFTVFLAVTLIFVFIRVIPGDPAAVILGDRFSGEAYREMLHQLGLDKPIYVQYLDYLKGMVHGNLGTSFHSKEDVLVGLLSQFRYTLQLAVAGLVVSSLLGVLLGIVAGLSRGRVADHLSMVLALLGMSVPAFWFGLLLIYVFGYALGWLPIVGVGEGSMSDVLIHLVLPTLAVGLRSAGLNARVTRSAMIEVLGEDYVRTARAKGLSERVVVYRHALRNAFLPIITAVGLDAARMLGGTTVVEVVFNRPGIGHLLVESVMSRDYPYIQGTLLLYVVLVIGTNLLVDLSYGLVDPRVRNT